jgi:hypothetical protein
VEGASSSELNKAEIQKLSIYFPLFPP